jgi:hypothetical protein
MRADWREKKRLRAQMVTPPIWPIPCGSADIDPDIDIDIERDCKLFDFPLEAVFQPGEWLWCAGFMSGVLRSMGACVDALGIGEIIRTFVLGRDIAAPTPSMPASELNGSFFFLGQKSIVRFKLPKIRIARVD